MGENLLKREWANLEFDDLRVLLEDRIGAPGQFSGKPGDNRLYLPLAGNSCRVALRFKGNRISAVERGPAFDPAEWSQIDATIDALLSTAPDKIGRNITFSGKRVAGWWRGAKSGVQILPPPVGAPAVPTEMGEHPFVLEFPLHSDTALQVTNKRRLREHRRLSLLLNVLLTARVNVEPMQTEHGWCLPHTQQAPWRSEWLQLSYFPGVDQIVIEELSPPGGDPLEALAPETYYATLGYDGKPLRVPSDLDESICLYRQLGQADREKFNRALFWLDVASRQWTTSMSSSFASLVSAIESLTERGKIHRVYCDECGEEREHDAPGPTAQFRNFFETHAPGSSLKERRNEMYSLRSSISHGDQLIAFDEGRAFGWDPPWAKQNELHRELWSITRIALRNYLANPGASRSPESARCGLEMFLARANNRLRRLLARFLLAR